MKDKAEDKNLSFEEAYEKLEATAKVVSDERTPLNDAIENYKIGKEYYEYCINILETAQQTIEMYDKSKESGSED